MLITISNLCTAPLTAHLQPQVQTVDVDKDAQFQCIVSGHPVHDVNWLHDGKPILKDNRIEVNLLHFSSLFWFGKLAKLFTARSARKRIWCVGKSNYFIMGKVRRWRRWRMKRVFM